MTHLFVRLFLVRVQGMASPMRSAHPTSADGARMAFVSSLGPFACNAYIPGFHAMAAELGVPLVALQATLSAYLAAFAISAIFCGPLSDALGRGPSCHPSRGARLL